MIYTYNNTGLQHFCLKYSLICLIFSVGCNGQQAFIPKGKVVAHRGAWKAKKHPQNSIASLKEAIALGCAGSEFDVNITSDDILVITHGPRYHKMNIGKTTYKKLAAVSLKNGEKLPVLSEYLSSGIKNNTTTQLFCEIKQSSIGKERTLQMTQMILDSVEKLDASEYMVYISFDYEALQKIVQLKPDAKVQYLGGDKSPEALRKDGIPGVNYRYKKLKTHPEYIISAKENGIILNSGTVNDTLDMDWLLANNLNYISTDEPGLLFERIKQSPTAHGWKLRWSDEFTKEGKPDSIKWQYETGLIRNREAQYYTNSTKNARTADGFLILEARKEQVNNPNFTDKDAKSWKKSTEFAKYSSASLTTERSASWTYGKIVVRAKLPKGVGLWPAIWMLGDTIDTVGWPQCGEIDIMEHVGFNPDSIFGTVHTSAFNHMKGTQVGKTIAITRPYEEFHTYGIEWDSEKIEFLLDGKVYHQFVNKHKTKEEWPFDQPFHLKLNIAIGGMLGGRKGIDDSVFPQQMLVDYVRVYQK